MLCHTRHVAVVHVTCTFVALITSSFEFCLIQYWPVSAALDVLQGAHKAEPGPVLSFWGWRQKGALLPGWGLEGRTFFATPGPSCHGVRSLTAHHLPLM